MISAAAMSTAFNLSEKLCLPGFVAAVTFGVATAVTLAAAADEARYALSQLLEAAAADGAPALVQPLAIFLLLHAARKGEVNFSFAGAWSFFPRRS